MKRRLLVVCLCVVAIFVSGCGRKSDTVKFVTWGSKNEMAIINPIVEQYNLTHDKKVEIIHVPQNYFHKLHLLFASNLAPDVIFLNNLYLKVYQNAGLLEDLTDYVNKTEYFENALYAMSVDDRIYAVPRDISSFVVFYNKTLFKKAKILPDKNWSMDDFYDTAKKLKTVADYGFCTEFEPAYWENFVSTLNKPPVMDGEITLDEEKSLEALQRLSDNINKEKAGVDKEGLALSPCAQLFLNQKTPIFISGRWSVPKLDEWTKVNKSFGYGVLPFPDGGSKYYIPLNASGWAVSKKSKNKETAIDFVMFISNDENMKKLAASGLITPAKKSVAYSGEFKNGEVFLEIISKSTPNIVPKDYKFIIDKLNILVSSVLGGYKTVDEIKDEIRVNR